MLTKTDLFAIEKLTRKIVREEVGKESRDTREQLEAQIRLVRMDLSNRIDDLENRIKGVDMHVEEVQKELKSVKKDIRKIKHDVSVLILSTNRDDMQLFKRVKRIEAHLQMT